ncbi:SRPBCC domain-containing protein [Streptomyces sp. NPDC004111]|uniref:SRPBCC family protein n=1 Tax=Streptomyces sp. NPDC004111 TaxID=3364690 RepID=UPI00367B2F86
MASDSPAPGASGIDLSRVFDAPGERVYEAWTEPERFAGWFGAPLDVPVSGVLLDVRPGGAWHATTVAPDGAELPFWGEYQEVVPPRRLMFTLADRSSDDGAEGELVVVTFEDLGDGRTAMRFQQLGGNLGGEGYARAEAGWSRFFDHLADQLAGPPAPGAKVTGHDDN